MAKKSSQSVRQKSTFEENKKRSKEIQAALAEDYPMAGNLTGEDMMWRSLTTNAQRDLNTITQKRMQEIAFYLFDTNPMAKRIIEIVRDFVVGDGFSFQAEDDKVQEIIDEFINDPDNDLECTIDENVQELCLFGENCFPVMVNPYDGSVKLSYIDPAWIIKILKSKKNPRWNDEVIWKTPRMRQERTSRIVQVDRNIKSKSYGRLTGDILYFPINKPINATRGRSDLLCLADWLDGHDQFLFARLERAFLLNAFIWDVEAQGMNKEQLEEFVKTIASPKPGSLRAHNEKVKWSAVAPKLEAQDASNEARLFKNQILGGAGYPEHWFAEGSKTTRATALEMGLPTLKKLKARQKKVKGQYKFMIKFVIDQAIIANRIPDTTNTNFNIVASPISSRDDKVLAQAINGFADALVKAVQNKWVSNKEAGNAFRTLVSQIGMDDVSSIGSSYHDRPDEEPEDNEEPSTTGDAE